MCGIIGFSLLPNAGSVYGNHFTDCIRSLAHRGPDSSGGIGVQATGSRIEDISPGSRYRFGIGHTRLAILDLSENGHQPFSDGMGNYLVFNGEVYNYIELREELRKLGHSFVTETDTEVILAAYRQYGDSCVQKFNGMWAFALFNSNKNILFLSRDRFGVKPFYYISSPGTFVFASEIRPLFQFTKTQPVVSRNRLADALINDIVDSPEQTIYAGVHQLPAGHVAHLRLSDHKWQCKRYWRLPQDRDLDPDDDSALDTYEHLIEDSVRIRLRADVPVAITLSGGVDSSVIALAFSRVNKNSIPVFTSHFPEYQDIDETAHAMEVAKSCRLKTKLVQPDVSRLLEDEINLCRHQELPFGSLSLYVHWAIIKRIKEHGTKVILSGQGGDELFLGYERYFVAKVLSSLPDFPRAVLDFWNCAKNSRLGLRGMAAYQTYFVSNKLQRLRRQKRLQSIINPYILSPASRLTRKVPANLWKLQEQEITGEQLIHLLRYDDRTTGAQGMETRLPFLDYRLVEFAYRLPWKFKIRDGWSKWISRAYLARHGLHAIAWRKNKLGFNAPAHWIPRLWERHGQELINGDMANVILKNPVDLKYLQASSSWKVYNLLELAKIMNWREIADDH